MKTKYRFCKYAVISMSVAIFLISCYSKDNLVYQNPYEEKTAENISSENVNKFLSSVRKVDGEAEAKYRMARYFQNKNKHKIAIEELKEVILIDPFFAKAYNALGVSYDQLREFKNAIHFYKLAIKIDPNLDYVYNNLGFSRLLSGDYDRAIDAFHKAIALDEKNERFRNNLGLAYAKKGEYELALEQFKITGDELSANHKLGQILYKEGKYELAGKYNALSSQTKVSSHTAPPVSSDGIEKDPQPEMLQEPIINESRTPQKQDEVAAELKGDDFYTKGTQNKPSETIGISENRRSSLNYSKEMNETSNKEHRISKDYTVEFEIEISNGNGVDGMAKRLANYLTKKGFKVTRLRNARCYNHESTKIFYYNGYAQDISRLLKEIPVECDKKNLIELKQTDKHIKILIGKDMIPHDRVISSTETVKNAS
jgi:Flp pilus assembly protein TadD